MKFTEIAKLSFDKPRVDEAVFVVGAGCEGVPCDRRSMGEGYLKFARTEIVALHQSFFPTNDKYFQLDNYLIASGEEGTIHAGDSGGPVYDLQNRQIGVTAQGGGLVDSNHVWLGHPSARSFLESNLKE